MLTNCIEIIKAFAVLIAAGVAWYGIDSWRREARWKIKYSLAEEVLTLAYEIRDAIKAIRSPASHRGEGSTRPKAEHEYPDEVSLMDRAYIPFERYEKYKEPFNKFQAAKYRFMAIYGSEHEELFRRIDKITNEIFTSAFMLGTIYWKEQGKAHWDIESSEFKRHLKEMHYHEDRFWSTGENDELSQKVNAVIVDFEKICAETVRENKK